MRLACHELGGAGSPVLLLHGLAGYAGEWSQTAEWLSERHRVVAFDARGHGRSERFPRDVSYAAHVADAAYVIERLELSPCTAIGQSLGGLTALLLAATPHHPLLSRRDPHHPLLSWRDPTIPYSAAGPPPSPARRRRSRRRCQ